MDVLHTLLDGKASVAEIHRAAMGWLGLNKDAFWIIVEGYGRIANDAGLTDALVEQLPSEQSPPLVEGRVEVRSQPAGQMPRPQVFYMQIDLPLGLPRGGNS